MDVRFLTDENFRGPFLSALLTVAAENHLEVDVVRVQDIGLSGAADPVVLDRASRDSRVVLTFDLRTMPRHASDRMEQGLPMSGLLVIGSRRRGRSPRDAAEDVILEVIDRIDYRRGWDNQVVIL